MQANAPARRVAEPGQTIVVRRAKFVMAPACSRPGNVRRLSCSSRVTVRAVSDRRTKDKSDRLGEYPFPARSDLRIFGRRIRGGAALGG